MRSLADRIEIYRAFSQYYQGNLQAGLHAVRLCDDSADIALTDTVWQEAEFDFNRLFVGPQRLQAAPYASVYLDENQLVMQEETLKVRAIYASIGLQVEEKNHIPDDFMGYELYFLAGLLELAGADDVETAEAAKSMHQEFLQKHIENWAYLHLDKVMEIAKTEYCRKVAEVLKVFLQEEMKS